MRLSQIARKYNTGVDTILAHLGLSIDTSPNIKLNVGQVAGIEKEFASSADQRKKADQVVIGQKRKEEGDSPSLAGQKREEIKTRREIFGTRIKKENTSKAPFREPIVIQKPKTLGYLKAEIKPETKPETKPITVVKETTSYTPEEPRRIKITNKAAPMITSSASGPIVGFTVLGTVKVPEKRIKKTVDERSRSGSASEKYKGPTTPKHIETTAAEMELQVKKMLQSLQERRKGDSQRTKYRKQKKQRVAQIQSDRREQAIAEAKVLKIAPSTTVGQLAKLIDSTPSEVLATCLDLGIIATVNQRLDEEAIGLIAESMGYKTEFVTLTDHLRETNEDESKMKSSWPIVTVMGHVDHGKTTLLDYIRNTNVTSEESGGITQRLSAYSAQTKSGREVVFLDTPGHEAFKAMRARGAQITDVVIIIIAADDGVMPQTEEAIKHAKQTGAPIVIAINKMDKPGADVERIKEQLAKIDVLVDDWGGKYQTQPISAKTGEGIDELLEKVLLEAEVLELKANPDRSAQGSVIEGSYQRGKGYVASLIVTTGTLRMRDIVLAGQNYGKVKAIVNSAGKHIKEAGPATPVRVLGLNGAPSPGEPFYVLKTEQEAAKIASEYLRAQRDQSLRSHKTLSIDEIQQRSNLEQYHEVPLILKGNEGGMVEALASELFSLNNEELTIKILRTGVGEINESDIDFAATSGALVLGFDVQVSTKARTVAREKKVDVSRHVLLQKALEYVEKYVEELRTPDTIEVVIGKAEVKKVFTIRGIGIVAGCCVTSGAIKAKGNVRLMRDGEVCFSGPVQKLKREKETIKEALKDTECGISAAFKDVQPGDFIEAFTVQPRNKDKT